MQFIILYILFTYSLVFSFFYYSLSLCLDHASYVRNYRLIEKIVYVLSVNNDNHSHPLESHHPANCHSGLGFPHREIIHIEKNPAGVFPAFIHASSLLYFSVIFDALKRKSDSCTPRNQTIFLQQNRQADRWNI